ncbi:MAG: alanine dehydrogenase [Pseudomonadales bacterium]|jgi:alanine dehydrogenase|nr:alanine dehydrogenase [Gammaproteobacteria bacterium]MDP6024583.1 alanine dehydrogenase [Pseudomonadales bacterium]MDP6315472.1 alanine dehydrogenase [Pseudomonadales bacterium]MDP7315071.1 alanine dehydrogenase [Pseudomonadales bacterium]|tara:strand:+ start:2378 stop:3496 length:1119 start_codon:yes stop_codon:yes gene_type:complete
MRIGVPAEIKNNEFRVGLVPAGVRELTRHGHDVIVQSNAGAGIGFEDTSYQSAGASVIDSAEEVFAEAEMIVKVKEPQAVERKLLRAGQTLFTYLHLAPDFQQTEDLLKSGSTCIAYETVTDPMGGLPLLAPMSEVAGRMSIQAGAMCMEKSHGGRGILLGGVPGVIQGQVLILGGGVVGQNAAQMAVGLGARVTVVDRSLEVLRRLDYLFGNRIQTLYSTHDAVEEVALNADLIIGAVLIPGASAPKLISREIVERMNAGTVMVDVAIDQGGCFETSHATTHDEPTYIIDDVVHYCVANMPGAVARTSAAALNNATLPYVLELADKGVKNALLGNVHLLHGLNVYHGNVTNEFVGAAHQLDYINPKKAIAA